MINDEFRKMALEVCTPITESLVDLLCNIFKGMSDVQDVPEEYQKQLMQDILKSFSEGLVSTIKASIPSNLEEQIKEAINGRK